MEIGVVLEMNQGSISLGKTYRYLLKSCKAAYEQVNAEAAAETNSSNSNPMEGDLEIAAHSIKFGEEEQARRLYLDVLNVFA